MTIDLYTLLSFLDDLERGAAWGGIHLRISDPTAQPPIILQWQHPGGGRITLRLDPDSILPEHLPALQAALHTCALYSPLLLTNTH